VIGKNGETIKALQQFTGAQIQIDQRCDPTRVSIAGPAKAMQMATSMVQVGARAHEVFYKQVATNSRWMPPDAGV
jgi:rRNA processing protein Krr1/Pno1